MSLFSAPVLLMAALFFAPLCCTFPPPDLDPSTPFPPEAEESTVSPAFHGQLGSSIALGEPRVQLHGFTGLKPGHFTRGPNSFDISSGAFTAPIGGIYQFTAQVHFSRSNLLRTSIDLESSVTVAICISGNCTEKASLQSSSAISSEKFSAVATGILDIDAGQTVSVVVFSNGNSDRRIVIDNSSSFMGHFIQD